MLILFMLINKLLINLILFIVIIILSSNLFEVISLVSRHIRFSGWVLKPNTRIQFEVNKLHQDNIKVQESCHNPVIDINWQIGWVLVWNQVGDLLVHDFSLVVNTLDADKTLFQGVGFNDVQLEMFQQFSACLYFRLGKTELFMGREDGEKGHQ